MKTPHEITVARNAAQRRVARSIVPAFGSNSQSLRRRLVSSKVRSLELDVDKDLIIVAVSWQDRSRSLRLGTPQCHSGCLSHLKESYDSDFDAVDGREGVEQAVPLVSAFATDPELASGCTEVEGWRFQIVDRHRVAEDREVALFLWKTF